MSQGESRIMKEPPRRPSLNERMDHILPFCSHEFFTKNEVIFPLGKTLSSSLENDNLKAHRPLETRRRDVGYQLRINWSFSFFMGSSKKSCSKCILESCGLPRAKRVFAMEY